nr:hypothetical protein [Tanacetum cinerariifolium]
MRNGNSYSLCGGTDHNKRTCTGFQVDARKKNLSGANYNDWFHQLRIALRVEKKLNTIEHHIPPAPVAGSTNQVLEDCNKIYDVHNKVSCLMLDSMYLELQRKFENYAPYDMLQELKSMFEKQAEVKRFDLIQMFHAFKQEDGHYVSSFVLKIKSYVEQLECLSYVLPQDISAGLILNGFTNNFDGFVRNYNMHNMEKIIGELHALLIEYEKGLPKKAATLQVFAIQGGRIQKPNKKPQVAKGKGKAKSKGKNKLAYASKPKHPTPAAKEHSTKDAACHHFKEVGHRIRNYPVHLVELMKKNKQAGSANTSSIFTIELFSFPNKSWVYDTGCGTHICTTTRGLKEERKMEQRATYLYVGGGQWCARTNRSYWKL